VILSEVEIQKALKSEKIFITPAPLKNQYDTSSLNLRISDEFKEFDPDLFDPKGVAIQLDYDALDPNKLKPYLKLLPVEADGTVILEPKKKLVLATTLESIYLPRESGIAARIEGRSSIARLGLVVHLSAPAVKMGWKGPLTLEVVNFGPFHIKLHPKKSQICHLIFERVDGKAKAPDSQFHNQDTVMGRKKKGRPKR